MKDLNDIPQLMDGAFGYLPDILLALRAQAAGLVFGAGFGRAQLDVDQVRAAGGAKFLLKAANQGAGFFIQRFPAVICRAAAAGHAQSQDPAGEGAAGPAGFGEPAAKGGGNRRDEIGVDSLLGRNCGHDAFRSIVAVVPECGGQFGGFLRGNGLGLDLHGFLFLIEVYLSNRHRPACWAAW